MSPRPGQSAANAPNDAKRSSRRTTRASSQASDLGAGFFSDLEPGRRGEILDAALEEFAERSYEGGSMRGIAERVGVTEPALYRHFPGKRALFEAFVALAARRLLTEGHALAQAATSDPAMLADPRPALAAALDDRSAMLRRFRRIIRTVLAEVVRDEGFMSIWETELIVPGTEFMSGVIGEIDAEFGIERTPRQMQSATRIMMTMLVGYILSGLVYDRDDSEPMADAICRSMGWSRR